MRYVVTVNGNQYEVEVEKVGGGYQPMSRHTANAPIPKTVPPVPSVAPVEVQAPAAPVAPAPVQSTTSSVSASDTKMEAPMPGAILDVKVNVGDRVKNGQVLLILEAMKMENEIVSPVDGIITSVSIKKGDSVDSGDSLVTIK